MDREIEGDLWWYAIEEEAILIEEMERAREEDYQHYMSLRQQKRPAELAFEDD